MIKAIRPVVAALIGFALSSPPANAQPFIWDPTFTATALGGGTGTWDTVTANWYNGTTNSDVVWPGQAGIFSGTAGTVTIAPGGVSATGLIFNSTGYAIGGDVLTLTGAGTITIASPLVTGTSSGQFVLTDTIGSAIGGSVGLTKLGTGNLVLTGTNTYTGATTVAGGTLTLDFNAAGATTILNPNNALVFGGSNLPAGTFAVNGATAGSNQSVNNVTLSSGSAAISATSNTGAMTLNLGSITRSTGTALSFTLPVAGSITTTTANANPAGGQQTILGGYAVVAGTAPSTWAVSGSGATAGAISGLATYTVNAMTAGADIDIKAATTSAATVTVNSLRLSSTTGGVTPNFLLTLSNPLTVATGGVLLAGAASANTAISGSTITSGSGELIFNNYSRIDGTARELLIASQVTGNINVVINGVGSNGTGGQVELQNTANNFVGTVTVLGGRLGNGSPANAAMGLGSASNPVIVVGTAAGGGQYFMQNAAVTRNFTISGFGWAESLGSFGAFRPRSTVSGTITLAGDARIGVNNSAVLSGKITGPYQLALTANFNATQQTITLSNTANDYSGGTRIERGTILMGATNALPTSTLVTFGTTYLTTDTLHPPASAGVTAPTLNINGFATQVGGLAVEANDTAGAALGNPTVTNTGAAATFTVNALTNSTFGGVITNGANALNFAKSGTATLTLAGANTYTGTTTVNGGTLALVSSSSTNNIGSSSGVTVGAGGTLNVTGITAPGGFTLAGTQSLINNGTFNGGPVTAPGGSLVGGTGTYSSDVAVSGGTLTGGTATTIGTIAAIGGNLSVTSGSTFKIKFNGAASDQIGTLAGSASFAGNSTLSIAQLGATSNPSYTILTAAGGLSGLTAGTLTTIGRTTYSVDATGLANNSLVIDVVGTPAHMRWVGGDTVHNPTRWENAQLDANWTTTDAVADTTHFYDGDFVTFNNNNNGNFTVNVTGTVSPGSITVSNGSGTTYTLADGGAGVIAGTGGLSMNSSDGTGTLVIGTHNTFSGPVSITSGIVSISASDNLGNAAATNTIAISGGGNLRATATLDLGATRSIALGTGGGTLDVPTAGNLLTVSGVISGTGTGDALTKVGLGTLKLSGTNIYNGPTVILAGTLLVTSSASLGAIPGGSVTVSSGGILDLGGGAAANALNFGQKQFIIAGNGDGTSGAITNSAAVNQQNGLQRVQLSADASFGGTNRFDIRAGQVGGVNAAQLDLQGHTLTKNGSFFFPLVATDVTDGNIVVNAGTLSIETTTNVPAGAGTSITFNAGTTWSFFGFAGTLARPIIINGAVNVGPNNNAVSTAASPITLNGDLTVSAVNANGTGTVALNGAISETGGPHSITKINNGTGNSVLVLGGNNTFSGGVNFNAGIVEISTVNNLGTGPLNFNGGTLRFATGSGGADVSVRTVNLNAGGGTIDTNGNNVTFANPIGNGGGGGLNKAGTGTLALGGANTYTGPTNVNAGTLLVGAAAGGTGSLAAASTVTVNGGTLGGFGTINGPITVNTGGTLAPGGSPGILTATNTVSMTPGSTYFAVLNGKTTPGTDFNQLSLVGGGVIDLGGATLTGTIGYPALPSDVITIITGGAVTNQFASGGTFNFGGYMGTISYPGNAVVLSGFTPVPEPAFVLLGCGAAAVCCVGARRRRQASRKCLGQGFWR